LPSPQTLDAPLIHRLTGQFRDARLEHQFRAFQVAQAQADIRVALLVAAAGVAMFAISDYFFLGLSSGFYRLLIVRAAVITGCVLVALRSSSSVILARPWLLSAGPVIISIGALFILAIRPETIMTQMISVVVIILGTYLFVPNLIAGMVASAAFLTTGFVVGCALWTGLDVAGLGVLGLLLISANCVGYMSARRFARLQREQFGLLLQEQSAKARLIEEISGREALEQRLRIIAQTDELTGCSSRRHFMQTAEAALALVRAQERPFSLCMIDVDRFKQINDTYGHAAGDRILQAVAEGCRTVLRAGEPLGRFGGEEFVAALPGASLDAACQIAERVRLHIAGLTFDETDPALRVTVTIGLSEVASSEPDLDPALNRADAAMYEGKRAGRNTVRTAAS
jgi:diguanylate cyclase (GGDEF)-like protein